MLRPSLLLTVALAAAGCATTTPHTAEPDTRASQANLQRLAHIAAFDLAGRMAVQAEYKGFSGRLRWQHADGSDRFSFYTPLGSQVAEIVAAPGNVTLVTSDRKVYNAEDAESLLQQTMGWSLPLAGLPDWVLGRPAAGPYQSIQWDAQGYLSRLTQHGWEIEYQDYASSGGTALPTKIVLKSLKLDLKLLVDEWQTAAAPEAP